MRVVKPWVRALQVNEGVYATWVAEAPKHASLTFWCLERGHIRTNDYLQWAVEHYQLPIVRSEYFQRPVNRELWDKIQSVANWGPDLLPLEEWDGVIFVACVEPPEQIQWSFPVRYVLASTRDLKIQWERLRSEPTSVSQTAAPSRAGPTPPAPPPMGPPKREVSESKLVLNVPNAAPPPLALESEASREALPPPVIQPPDGLSLNAEVTGILNLDSLKTEDSTSPSIIELESIQAPEGLKISSGHQIFEQDEVITGVIQNPSVAAPPPAAAGFTMSPSTPQIKTAPSKGGAIDSDQLAPKDLGLAKTETEVLAWAFQQLKQHFQFFWLLRLTDGALKVHSWDNGIKPASDQATAAIDLNQPSLFRIVARTRMPYHGHVVDSPLNTGFFKNWNLRATPSHVTAVPMINEQQLVAILVAGGDKPGQLDQVLRFAEKIGAAVGPLLSQKMAA